jgi:hypothetical protein
VEVEPDSAHACHLVSLFNMPNNKSSIDYFGAILKRLQAVPCRMKMAEEQCRTQGEMCPQPANLQWKCKECVSHIREQ